MYKKIFQNNKDIYGLTLIFFILWVTPILKLGITLNDSLQFRFKSSLGFLYFLSDGWHHQIAKGRPLDVISVFTTLLGYLSDNMFISKIFQMCIFFLTIFLIGCLIYKLFKDKLLSVLTAFLLLMYYPITFEHMPLEAYVCYTYFPIITLLLSLIYFVSFLEKSKRAYLLVSIAFYIITLLTVEHMVTFAPLYLLIGITHGSENNFIGNLKKSMIYIFIGVIYIYC